MEITCHLFGHTVVRSVAFYDASKTYLSGYSAATDNGTFASTVTVPSGAKYTRFSYGVPGGAATTPADYINSAIASRSEEHTSELQSLMRISYAVFCLKKKKNNTYTKITRP